MPPKRYNYRFGGFFIDSSSLSVPQILSCLLLIQRKLRCLAGVILRWILFLVLLNSF